MALNQRWNKRMLRAAHLIAALLITALSPAALAQKSSGHMDLDDLSSVYGAQLAAFRVMISKTDVICPQQTGLLRIAPNGLVTDIEALLWLVPELPRGDGKIVKGMDLSPVPAPDDFTYRRRLAMDSCRIDVDISEQQKQDGEWIPLLSLERPNAPSSRKNEDAPAMSPALEAFDRQMRATEHAGNLLQGRSGTFKSVVGFEGAKDCFNAVATYRIDQLGVTLFSGRPGGRAQPILHRARGFRCGPQHALSFAWLLPRWIYDQRVDFARWRLDSTTKPRWKSW
jgi:hypothetical protein